MENRGPIGPMPMPCQGLRGLPGALLEQAGVVRKGPEPVLSDGRQAMDAAEPRLGQAVAQRLSLPWSGGWVPPAHQGHWVFGGSLEKSSVAGA